MNIAETRTEAKKPLYKHYKLKNTADIPKKRERSKWTKENKCCFLSAIIKHGPDFLARELYNLLQLKDFQNKKNDVINKMYDFHMKVFKQHDGTGSSCHAP